MDLSLKYAGAQAAETPDEGGAGELSPLQTTLRHKWAILAFALLAAAATYVGLRFVTPTYTSAASITLDMEQLNLNGGNGPFSTPELSDEVLQTETEALYSPVLASAVVDQLGLTTIREFEKCDTKGGLIARLTGRATTTCVPDRKTATDTLLGTVMKFNPSHTAYEVDVGAVTHDPVLSARIANAYADEFVNWRLSNREARATQADHWLSGYLATLHDRMVAANDAVETYKQAHHLVGLGTSAPGTTPTTTLNQSLEQLNSQLTETDGELASHEATLAAVNGSGGALSSATALGSPIIQSLIEQRAQAAANLAQLRARYGDEHPRVVSAAAELARVNAQLQTEVRRSVVSLQGEVRALNGRRSAIEAQVQHLQGSVSGQSQADVRLEELTREADTENGLYRSLLERMKEIDAERHIQLADATVTIPAQPSYAPSSPHKAMMLAGAFLGALGIGAGLAFAREMTVSRFRDVRQLQNETGLPVLGAFARAPRGTTPRELVLEKPYSAESEMVHDVLSRLENDADRSSGGRTLLVTSALPNEGKSSFSVALGRQAAQSGLRTILLDGDLRRSSLQALTGEDAAKVSAAGPRTELAVSARIVSDPRSGLSVLPLSAMVGDARRIVAARGLAELIAGLRERYDMIIIDTPPVLAVPDTRTLTAFADDVVMVVDWTQNTRSAVNAAVDELRRVRAHMAGVVLSKIGLKDYASIAKSPVYDIRRYRSYLNRIPA